MERKDIDALRVSVRCAAVLEHDGWAIDLKESTRRAVKYRRGDAIVIVIHEGKGWFDPLSDAKGDIYSLVSHLENVGFAGALKRIEGLIDFVPTTPVRARLSRARDPAPSIPNRWHSRSAPRQGSPTWRYLTEFRAIPGAILAEAMRLGLLREGPRSSMWAKHVDNAGGVIGWEERGPEWRGFATGGSKQLFNFGPFGAARIAITEAAIDAMSLAALEGLREGTAYASTAGGWSPATAEAIRAFSVRPGMMLVAATDANAQGEAFAHRIRTIAREGGCDFGRLTPRLDDWNEDLKEGERKRRRRIKPTAACPTVASREAALGSRRPLTRPFREAAAKEGDEKA